MILFIAQNHMIRKASSWDQNQFYVATSLCFVNRSLIQILKPDIGGSSFRLQIVSSVYTPEVREDEKFFYASIFSLLEPIIFSLYRIKTWWTSPLPRTVKYGPCFDLLKGKPAFWFAKGTIRFGRPAFWKIL